MQQIAITALVVVMMIAVGLRSDPRDFRAALGRGRRLFWVFALNLVVVPGVAVLALTQVELPQAFIVGLLLCAASPGGSTGPLFAIQARGDVAAAVVAMIGLALVSVVTAPLTISWVLGLSTAVDARALVGPMILTLGAAQLLPLVVGMALRRWQPAIAGRLADPMSRAANLLLLVIIAGLLVTKGGVLLEVGALGVGLSILLVLLNLGVGALTAREVAPRRAFAMVTAVRNISLALLVSAAYFPDPRTDGAILTFGLFTMLLPFVAALLLKRRGPTAPAGPR
jgi:BASS family bile acid:Na+ symporter